MYSTDIKVDLKLRWESVLNLMKSNGVDALLVSTPANLFYTCSRVFSGYAYFSVSESEPMFFVKRPVGLKGDRVVYIRKVEDIALHVEMPVNIALEVESSSYSEVSRCLKVFGEAEVKNGSHILRLARSIKTDYEIDQVRISAKKHDESYAELSSVYREGMSDLDFSIEVERVLRQHGSLGMFRIAGSSMEIFFGSLLVGANADNPSPYDFAMCGEGLNKSLPVGVNGTIIKKGNTVMVDLCGNFTGYMSDMTRVFGLGELPELAYRVHDVSIQITREFEKITKEGVAASDIYNMAVEIAEKNGVSEYFMGYTQKAGFVGHGLGIEINELPVLAPRSRDIITKGMVIAFEPKFVLPVIGAVGIENTYVVTDKGVDKLTNTPESIVIL